MLKNLFDCKCRKKLLLIAVALLLMMIYFFPYLLKGKNSYILIHDNLNQINMLGIFDGKMSAEILPKFVDKNFTLPYTPAIFHLTHIKLDKLFFLYDFFWGFVFNEFLYRLIALIGIFLILAKYYQKSYDHFYLLLFSFAFVSLPFWPPGNLSVAGLPLLIISFIYLQHNRHVVISILFILLYAFYSNYFFIGVFNTLILATAALFLMFKRKLKFAFIAGFIIYILASIISHYPVFLNEVFYKIPTNRAVQDLSGDNLLQSIKMMLYNFAFSHPLSPSLHTYVILPSSLLLTWLIWQRKSLRSLKKIIPIWIVLILLAIISGLFYWRPVISFYNSIQLGFRLDRIYLYYPLLWFSLWFILLIWLKKNFKWGKQISLLLIILQLLINFYSYTYRALHQQPTFQEFFSEDQFERIAEKIGKIDRVGCLGFFPAVANYNGFKTVDSFSSYYPQKYKYDFRRIIQKELDQNSNLKNYFEQRGSALFLFDDKIGTNYRDQAKISKISSIICDLDLDELIKLDVKYLFSTVKIDNAEQICLRKISYKVEANDYYNLFVYELLGGYHEQ